MPKNPYQLYCIMILRGILSRMPFGSVLKWATKALWLDGLSSPGCCQNDFLTIIELMYIAPGLLVSRLMARNFNAPGVSWSSPSAPNHLSPFLEIIRRGGWNQRVIDPTISCSALQLILTLNLTHVLKFAETSSPGCDHLLLTSLFILATPSGYPQSKAGSYFKVIYLL